MKYRIFDNICKCYVGKVYDSSVKAHRRADKLDLQYGAIRYVVCLIK